MKRLVLAAALVAGMMSATPALARDSRAFTLRSTPILAGPERDYPVLRWLRANRAVTVHGCLDDQSWCDVSARADRGWVDGSDLAVTYRGRRTRIDAGINAELGIGIVSFLFGNYWDDHYRGRSFYAQRSRWEPQPGRIGQPPWNARARPADPYPRGSQPQPGWRQPGAGAPHGIDRPGPQPAVPRNRQAPAASPPAAAQPGWRQPGAGAPHGVDRPGAQLAVPRNRQVPAAKPPPAAPMRPSAPSQTPRQGPREGPGDQGPAKGDGRRQHD